MNKYVVSIVVSAVAALTPLIILIYGYWDAHQPKTGPVGNGTIAAISPVQLLLCIGVLLSGGFNVVIGIKKYREQKRKNEMDHHDN